MKDLDAPSSKGGKNVYKLKVITMPVFRPIQLVKSGAEQALAVTLKCKKLETIADQFKITNKIHQNRTCPLMQK